MTPPRIAVVGIGADGWAGLGDTARAAIHAAGRGRRLEAPARPAARRGHRRAPGAGRRRSTRSSTSSRPRATKTTCVLASGDPMLHGIGATLARSASAGDRLDVHPHPSAFALACARLGWPAADVELVSTVARPPETSLACSRPAARLIVYATGEDGARDRRPRPARARLRAQPLRRPRAARRARARSSSTRPPRRWSARWADPLHAIAIECRAARGTPLLPRTPGLPDDAYDGDGQLTKRHVRAMTLAALQPTPGAAAVGRRRGERLDRDRVAARGAVRARDRDRGAHRPRAPGDARTRSRSACPSSTSASARRRRRSPDSPTPDAVFVGGGVTDARPARRVPATRCTPAAGSSPTP